MGSPVWTLSNALSALRLILALPIGLALLRDEQPSLTLWVLIGVAIATDFLDGIAARALNSVSELGKILDPIADKILVGVVAFALAWRGTIPLWYVAAAITRDVLIVAGGLYLRRTERAVPSSNLPGKWSTVITALFLCLAIGKLTAPPWFDAALFGSVLMMIVSFGSYIRRFLSAIH